MTRQAAFPSDDIRLDPRSIDDLPKLRAKLGWRDRASAAPSRAARDTAAMLAAETVLEPALRDCDYGAWTGRSMADVEAGDPDGFANWLGDLAATPHGGESIADLIDRAKGWLDACATTPDTRLAIAPATMVRALVVAALDLPGDVFWRLDAAPLAVSRLTAQGGRWRLAGFNAAP